ncbi:hypothetical protein BZL54_23955 [Burkholderia ubonensis subsp. mesacidophila]|uniref:Uncharacterized protein n=1 Tax=Burkholderia ubonensis subsp. mesacidophila TaxID=265293 RepID=A0A2A4FA24_9BURK|nr:hypothetical protein BZL54_23955 [Burkholderia ubonensis subsp. mesacidophila]
MRASRATLRDARGRKVSDPACARRGAESPRCAAYTFFIDSPNATRARVAMHRRSREPGRPPFL